MKGLTLWAAKNAFLAIMFCLGIIAAGAWSVTKLPIDALPDVTNIQVQVVTRAAALSATEVEAQITQPIERGMAGILSVVRARLARQLSDAARGSLTTPIVPGFGPRCCQPARRAMRWR